MARDFFAERGIDPRKITNPSQVRDFFSERGVNPKSENMILGENIQSRHPMIGELLGKLSDTWLGKQLENAAPYAERANQLIEQSGIPEVAAGGFSHAMNLPISILNTPSYIGEQITGKKFPQLPYSDLSVFTPSKQKGTAYNIGGLGGDVLGGSGLFKLLSSGAKAINPRNISFLENILRGSGAGYAMGGEGNNRELGAALGSALPFAEKSFEFVAPYANALLPGGLGRNAAEVYKNKRTPFIAEYNKKLNEFEKSGASKNFKEPFFDKEADIVLKRMDPRNQEYFKEFLENPTLQGAHYAKSEIKAFQRGLEKKAVKQGKSWGSGDKKAYKASEKIEQDLESAMKNAFNASNNPNLSTEYFDLGSRYGKEMGPFINVPAFSQYSSEEIKPTTLAKKILSNDKFMKSKEASNIPGLKTRELLDEFPFLGKLFRGY